MQRVGRWVGRFHEGLRSRTHTYDVIVAALVGVLGGLGAVGFRWLVQRFQPLFWGGPFEISRLEAMDAFRLLLAPTLGGLITGLLVHLLAREAKGHGVPEVMQAIALRGGRIRPRVAAVKSLASAVTIASGGSVGREGPIVQIGAALGSSVGQVLRVTRRRLRTFAGCGAAAGIAATFNAPIAGALFVLEILLQDLRVTSFAPIIVSAVMATAVSREMLGDEIFVWVPPYELAHPFELLAYAVLGLAAAILGVLFIRVLTAAEEGAERLPVWPPLVTALGGTAVGVVALVSTPHAMGVGYEAIETALRNSPVWTFLGGVLVAKFVAVVITLSSGGSGGVFAPALVMGAMLGGLIGVVMNTLFPGSVGPIGAYALVGMGAMVASTTHAPLTAMIMLFELTSDYHIILPLMIACTLATLIGSRLFPESIYTEKLRQRGIDLRVGRDANVLRNLRASDILRPDAPTIHGRTPLLEVLGRIAHEDHQAYFVESDDGRLIGTLGLRELRPVLADIEAGKDILVAEDLAVAFGEPVRPEDTLDAVLARMHAEHVDILPVLAHGRLVGEVCLEDLLGAYRRETFKREMAVGMTDALAADHRSLRSLGDYVVAEVDTPPSFVGRSLADLDLRRREGITILVVKSSDPGSPPVVPTADHVLTPGAVLVVMGREKQVRAMRRHR